MDGAQHGDSYADYTDPVRQLLTIGEPNGYDPAKWPDYAAEFGIGHEQVGALIRYETRCDETRSISRLLATRRMSKSSWA